MAPLISAQGLSKRYGSAPLFQDLSFTVSEGERIGVIGPNGSGKSTLIEMLYGRVKPDGGDVAVRKGTRMSCVTQISEFSPGVTVRGVIEEAMERARVPEEERDSEFAETLGRASFTALDALAAELSGGWKKRLAIAEALVQRPDILLLDEPTNHLDFAGIGWLEGVLQSAGFACVVVSHDRYFLENVANEMVEISRAYEDGASTVVLGLDGMGKAERFADYSQWEEWQSAQKAAKKMSGLKDAPRSKGAVNGSGTPATAQKKLSYQESRELAGIEERITEAEQELQIRHKALEDPEVMGDHVRLQDVLAEMAKAQKIVDALYARWAELEQEQG